MDHGAINGIGWKWDGRGYLQVEHFTLLTITKLTVVEGSISGECLHRGHGHDIKNSMCALRCLFKGIVFGAGRTKEIYAHS